MKELMTERLVLRAWEREDAPFLLDLESRIETMRFLGPGVSRMRTIDQAFASILRRRAITEAGHGIWAVVQQETCSLLGNVLCKPMAYEAIQAIDLPPTTAATEIGWHLHPQAQGVGYATEAASAVLQYAADSNIDAAFALVDPRNTASQKVCQRLGMLLRRETRDYATPEHLVFEWDASTHRKSKSVER